MAVVATPIESVLVAQYQIGESGSGAPVTRQKSFASIKSAAADQDVYDAAEALFALIQYPLVGVRRDDRSELVNQ